MLGTFVTSAEFSGFSMGHFVGQEGLLAIRFVIPLLDGNRDKGAIGQWVTVRQMNRMGAVWL